MQNAIAVQKRQPPGSSLSRHWWNVAEALCSDSRNYSIRSSRYLHLAHLQHCYFLSKDPMVIHLLISKAKRLGLFEVAEVYFKPLL